MSLDQHDKIVDAVKARIEPGEAPRRSRRFRPRIWPFDTGASEDTFATPSQPASGEIDPNSMAGPEPAVFGGVNPGEEDQQADSAAGSSEESQGQPLGTALDGSIRGNELLDNAPRLPLARILRSTPFLLAAMIACLVGSTFLIRMAVPTETYVETAVKFQNYDKLNELEITDLQREMAKLLQTYPLRAQAWDILQKKSPGVPPGFLNNGLSFFRFDAINWSPEGAVRLRIDSDDPASDITRISAVTEAFYANLDSRNKKIDEYRSALAQQQRIRSENLARDAQLKTRIDELLPDAQRYMDLKQNMQAMERYLELADESNPLRMVARQNLQRIAGQVSEARQLSLQRDELLGQRVTLQAEDQKVGEEITRLTRAIDVFAYPEAPNPANLLIHDTRGAQRTIMRSTWVGVILFFAGLIGAFHLADSRAAERARRERRELLKLQAREAEAAAAVAAAVPKHHE